MRIEIVRVMCEITCSSLLFFNVDITHLLALYSFHIPLCAFRDYLIIPRSNGNFFPWSMLDFINIIVQFTILKLILKWIIEVPHDFHSNFIQSLTLNFCVTFYILIIFFIISFPDVTMSISVEEFFPEIKSNLTKIQWSHATNTKDLLTKALNSSEYIYDLIQAF